MVYRDLKLPLSINYAFCMLQCQVKRTSFNYILSSQTLTKQDTRNYFDTHTHIGSASTKRPLNRKSNQVRLSHFASVATEGWDANYNLQILIISIKIYPAVFFYVLVHSTPAFTTSNAVRNTLMPNKNVFAAALTFSISLFLVTIHSSIHSKFGLWCVSVRKP